MSCTYVIAFGAALGILFFITWHTHNKIVTWDETLVPNWLAAFAAGKAVVVPLLAFVFELFHTCNQKKKKNSFTLNTSHSCSKGLFLNNHIEALKKKRSFGRPEQREHESGRNLIIAAHLNNSMHCSFVQQGMLLYKCWSSGHFDCQSFPFSFSPVSTKHFKSENVFFFISL